MFLHTSVLPALNFHYHFPPGFSVKLTQEDNTGFEGNVVDVIVRLVGQIFGEVDVQLELLILSEFEQRNLGTITDVTDAAERK